MQSITRYKILNHKTFKCYTIPRGEGDFAEALPIFQREHVVARFGLQRFVGAADHDDDRVAHTLLRGDPLYALSTHVANP